MKVSEFFIKLGAPLLNRRWSWGAVSDLDCTVFLRVWQDQIRTYNGCRYVRVVRPVNTRNVDKPGFQERLRHIATVQQGAPCYMIMCVAEDADASHREIQSFNDDELFVGGNIVDLDDDGGSWIQITGQVSSRSLFRT